MKVLKEARNPYIESHKVRNIGTFALLILIGVVMFTMGAYYFILPMLFVAWLPFAISAIFLRRYYTWEAGTTGEKAVAKVLQELDDSYYLLSNVRLPRGKGDIDHVILGPNGVFAIETKNYSGKVMCYGDDWHRQRRGMKEKTQIDSISEQARRGASDLRSFIRRKNRLAVPVSPICVFTNPSVQLDLKEPAVPVLRLNELIGFVKSAPPSAPLTEREIQKMSNSILKGSSR